MSFHSGRPVLQIYIVHTFLPKMKQYYYWNPANLAVHNSCCYHSCYSSKDCHSSTDILRLHSIHPSNHCCSHSSSCPNHIHMDRNESKDTTNHNIHTKTDHSSHMTEPTSYILNKYLLPMSMGCNHTNTCWYRKDHNNWSSTEYKICVCV